MIIYDVLVILMSIDAPLACDDAVELVKYVNDNHKGAFVEKISKRELHETIFDHTDTKCWPAYSLY